jgi:hypothetical protein
MLGAKPREEVGYSTARQGTISDRDCRFDLKEEGSRIGRELDLELIQTRMTQKPLLWVEVGKSACLLVGIRELRLSPLAQYDPQCPSFLDFLSGCLVRVLWTCRSS